MNTQEIFQNMTKKVASDIKLGDIIQSPHTSTYWGAVYHIDNAERKKKITFHVKFIAGEMIGKEWDYTFLKATQITVSKKH